MDGYTLFLVIVGAITMTRRLFRLIDKIEQPPHCGRREMRKEHRA